MRVLVIDDYKENYSGDKIARSASEGLDALFNDGPWDRLYLDYDLDDEYERTGLTIIEILQSKPEYAPKEIIPISSDSEANLIMTQAIQEIKLIKNKGE